MKIAFPCACSTSSSTGARMRVSAIARDFGQRGVGGGDRLATCAELFENAWQRVVAAASAGRIGPCQPPIAVRDDLQRLALVVNVTNDGDRRQFSGRPALDQGDRPTPSGLVVLPRALLWSTEFDMSGAAIAVDGKDPG